MTTTIPTVPESNCESDRSENRSNNQRSVRGPPTLKIRMAKANRKADRKVKLAMPQNSEGNQECVPRNGDSTALAAQNGELNQNLTGIIQNKIDDHSIVGCIPIGALTTYFSTDSEKGQKQSIFMYAALAFFLLTVCLDYWIRTNSKSAKIGTILMLAPIARIVHFGFMACYNVVELNQHLPLVFIILSYFLFSKLVSVYTSVVYLTFFSFILIISTQILPLLVLFAMYVVRRHKLLFSVVTEKQANWIVNGVIFLAILPALIFLWKLLDPMTETK